MKFQLICFVDEIEMAERVKSEMLFELYRRMKDAAVRLAYPRQELDLKGPAFGEGPARAPGERPSRTCNRRGKSQSGRDGTVRRWRWRLSCDVPPRSPDRSNTSGYGGLEAWPAPGDVLLQSAGAFRFSALGALARDARRRRPLRRTPCSI